MHLAPPVVAMPLPHQPFDAAAHDYHFAGTPAKLAIADDLARSLAKLTPADRAFIDQVLSETFNRNVVLARVRDYFRSKRLGAGNAG